MQTEFRRDLSVGCNFQILSVSQVRTYLQIATPMRAVAAIGTMYAFIHLDRQGHQIKKTIPVQVENSFLFFLSNIQSITPTFKPDVQIAMADPVGPGGSY